jgi:acyl-CoA dehydrogenase
MSQFLVDMDTPGLTVRPIVNQLGEHDFNEVTFDDVLVPHENLIGEEGDGWKQVGAELAFERSGPERYLSSTQLLLEMLDAADPDDPRHAVALGRIVAQYGTLRQMSLGVAVMLSRGENPALAAALVKDQGALVEQAMPDIAHDLFGGRPTPTPRWPGDALHHAGGAVVQPARRHARDPARHHRQGTGPEMSDIDDLIADSVAPAVCRPGRQGRPRARRGRRVRRRAVAAGGGRRPAADAGHRSRRRPGPGPGAAYPVLRGLGYWQVPLPLAETMVAAQLLSAPACRCPDGPVDADRTRPGQRTADPCADGGGAAFVSGTAHGVPWARHAQAAVLSLADGRLALLDLRGAPGVTVQPHADTAGLPADTLVLADARCVAAVAAHPLPLAQPVWTLGAVARSAMMVGALEWTLAQAVQYAGDRVQFGKPIGKNQAIQQNLALMAGDVAAARMAALVAVNDAPGPQGCDGAACLFSAAVAKVRCGEAATRGTGIAHQVHGAIGFTQEHALHFATRRLWAWRADFGSDAHWAAELGRAAIQARAAGFWPALTHKHFDALR